MKVKKAYQLDKDDFVKFGFYAVKKGVIAELILIAVIAFVGAYFIVDRQYFFFGGLISTISAAAIMIPILYYSAYKSTVKNYERYSREFAMVETTVDKRGFTQESVIGKTTVPFNKLYKVCESKYGIYVYVSSRQAIILSKKIFDNDEVETMRKLFRKNMESKRVHLY